VVKRRLASVVALSAATALASCADVLGLKDFELEPDGGGAEDSGRAEAGTDSALDAIAEVAPESGMDGFVDSPAEAPVDAPADILPDVPADVPCVGSMSDSRNCGACGHDCEGGSCSRGVCTPFVLKSGVTAFDLASDGSTLYWVDGKAGGTVARCGVTSCTPSPIVSSRPMPIRIALDASGTPFWTEFGTGTTTDGSVWTLNAGGPAMIAAHRFGPEGIVADSSFVYWAELDGNDLVRYARSTATPSTFGPAQTGPVSVVLDGTGGAYWTDSGDGTVNTCPVANCMAATTTPVVPGRTSPWGLAIDASFLYVTELTGTGSVLRCDHAGGGLTQLGGGPQSFPLRIVSDGTSVYWTNQGSASGNGSVMQCTGTVCAPIAMGLASPAGIAVDSRAIYYGTVGDSTLWKVVK
jgi:hypothetical protein